MVATGSPANIDRARGHRHRQHPARGRRQDFAFGNLLFDHRAFGGARFQRIGGDVERGLRGVQRGFRRRAVRKQFLRPVEIGLGFGELGLEAGDLCVERLDLQREFFVSDGGDNLVLRDVIAALHRKIHDGAADSGPRRLDIGTFDRGKHGLLVGDRLRCDDKSFLGQRVLSERHQHGRRHDGGADGDTSHRYAKPCHCGSWSRAHGCRP